MTTTETINVAANAHAAHVAAVRRHADHTAKVNAAAASLREARASRALLLDRAAAGEELDAEALRTADETIAATGRDHEVADAIARGSARKAHEAEIAVEAAKAAECERAFTAAVEQRIEKAEEVDRCLAALRAAFREFDDAGRGVTFARQAAGTHNYGLRAIAARNYVLAELPANQWPKTRTAEDGAVLGYTVTLPTDANLNAKPLQKDASLAAAERSMWRVPVPQPAAEAA